MTFIVLPASIADIRAVYDVYFSAFEGELINQILFPWDIDDEQFRKGHAEHTLEYWHKDKIQYTFKCIDTETNKIIGMALWDIHWKPRDEAERPKPSIDWLKGSEKERAQKFIFPFWEKKEELLGGKEHVCKFYISQPCGLKLTSSDCHVIAVEPQYQRKGIGKLLMKWGIDMAEQLSVPLYLEATDRSIGLYKKLDFEKLDQGVILSPFVTKKAEDIEAPLMIRMPSNSAVSFDEWRKEK